MADTTDALLTSEAQQLFADSAILYGLAALMTYEYVLTFPREVATIWPKRKRSGPAWLFIVNRYLLVIATVLNCSPYPSARVRSFFALYGFLPLIQCNGTIRLGQAVGLAQYIVFAAFNALRVYALWNSNIACAVLVLALGLIPIATNIYVFCFATPLFLEDPLFGNLCTATIALSPDLYFRLLMTTRASVIAGDIIVLSVTWLKTWRTYRMASGVNMKVSLSYLILRDGTIYFVILLALNILQTLVSGVSFFEKLEPVNVFIVTLTPILISRFLLNLRDAAQHDGTSTYDAYDSHFSIPGFQAPTTGMGALTGNMGALLDRDDDSSDLMFAGLNTQVDNSSSEEGCPKQINYGSYDSPDTENHHTIEEEPRDV